jgi:hypothetical protein
MTITTLDPQPAACVTALACAIALGLFAATPARAAVSFNTTFDASADMLTPEEREAIVWHVQAAGTRWTDAVHAPLPSLIEIQISIADIPTANGASASTALIDTIDGRETYEQGVAHELFYNEDPTGPGPDGLITFGLDYLRNELWFDPDPFARTAPVPADRTDAMSTILHEFGHIIAYNGWADLATGEPPDTYWSIWDSWMAPGSAPVFAGPAAVSAWGSAPALTIGNINHWGNPPPGIGVSVARCVPAPVAWRWNAPVPPTCSAPPSADRPRGVTGDANLIGELMNGVVFYRGTRYDISPLDRAVLQDVRLIPDVIFDDGFE